MSCENSWEYRMKMGMMMESGMIEKTKKNEREVFSRKAPKDMYRVIGEDIRSNSAWLNGDFHTQEEALMHANEKHGDFVKMHVYNDKEEKVDESKHFSSRFIY